MYAANIATISLLFKMSINDYHKIMEGNKGMAKFCPECANPINDSSMPFCSKCGAKLPGTSPEVQPQFCRTCGNPIGDNNAPFCPKCGAKRQIIPLEVPHTYPSYIPPVSKEPIKPPVKRSTGEWILIGCAGIIFLIILLSYPYIIHHGGVVGVLSGNTQDSRDQIFAKNLSEIVLTINDLPKGWKTFGSPNVTKNSYSSKFIKVVGLTPYVIYLNINRYPTIDQAKTEYISKKAEITQFTVESVNIGIEGFGYVNDDSSIVEFRQGNIIVRTQYGVGGIVSTFDTLSIDDAKNYANIVVDRINQ